MFASHRISDSDRIGSDRARLTCKTSFHFQHFIFVFVSVSLYHSFFVHFVVAAVRCFNDEIYILSLIYQSEWRAIATIAAQSRMLICEADFYFIFSLIFLNFDLFHFGIKNRLSNAKQTVDRAATNAIYILYTSQPIWPDLR